MTQLSYTRASNKKGGQPALPFDSIMNSTYNNINNGSAIINDSIDAEQLYSTTNQTLQQQYPNKIAAV